MAARSVTLSLLTECAGIAAHFFSLVTKRAVVINRAVTKQAEKRIVATAGNLRRVQTGVTGTR